MSQRQTASHPNAIVVREIIESLQSHFVTQLSQKAVTLNPTFEPFIPVEWLRDEGVHGGGVRYMAQDTLFNRASVNMSQVFYEGNPDKPLSSATAISSIIHPSHPLAPSIHLHISWTQLQSGKGYWRIMADLNPAIPDESDKNVFSSVLREISGDLYAEASDQGDRYFYIPALERHRGVSHFYLEQFDSGDWQSDSDLAVRFGTGVINTYCDIFLKRQQTSAAISSSERQLQLDYHTLYFLQVLSLDRGTTSGLLAHGNNDIGILGSLPRYINRQLLAQWSTLVPEPQPALLKGMLDIIPGEVTVEIDDSVKQQLANVVRGFYQKYPEAIELQARGNVLPPTVKNHGVK